MWFRYWQTLCQGLCHQPGFFNITADNITWSALRDQSQTIARLSCLLFCSHRFIPHCFLLSVKLPFALSFSPKTPGINWMEIFLSEQGEPVCYIIHLQQVRTVQEWTPLRYDTFWLSPSCTHTRWCLPPWPTTPNTITIRTTASSRIFFVAHARRPISDLLRKEKTI